MIPSRMLLKRRKVTDQGSGPPAVLLNGEIAYDEKDQVLYYGSGNDGSGNATDINPIAGWYTSILKDAELYSSPTLLTQSTDYLIININGVQKAIKLYDLDGGAPINISQYFYATTDSSWYNLANWFTDSSHTNNATTLPTSSTDVVILTNSLSAFINIDDNRWIQPKSMIANVGVEFNSNQNGTITMNITGASGCVVFTGNSSYGN